LLAGLAENPLEPAYGELPPVACHEVEPLTWLPGREGKVSIGASDNGFAFDSERPRHDVMLIPHAIAARPVTNREWSEFIADGGYETATLWLSDGWDWVRRDGIEAPLYWHGDGTAFTLGGRREIDGAAPVAHVSFYEADAFARWAGARLPTEAEWEDSAASADPWLGHQLDTAGPVAPRPGGGMFGDVWQWTGSAYLPYPGFKIAAGAVGEYNGKFMSGQMVLKGASCATPRGHSRASYRNFFPPSARWQFTGVRLARDS
jgi:ergothioneine biosynthesis protein EgtB